MAFPDTPLDVLFELLAGGQWIPVPTYERDTIEVDTGRGDRAAQTDPGRLAITINNRSGRFSPRNAESDLYGLIGRNTRGRLSVPGTVSYLELDGNAANNASTPDHASLDITGDLDVRWEGEADWYAPGAQILIGKWGASGDRSYHLRLQDGGLRLHVTTDGTTGPFVSLQLPQLPRHAALRATLDADNGAGGRTWRMYWATSLDGPWTQFDDDVIGTPALTVFSGSAPLTIAPEQLDATPVRQPVTGRCFRAEVRNGIDGTVVASPDFTAQAAGTTSFADSAGRTWALSGTAVIRDRADLIVVEVPEWPQHWQPDESDAWVPIEGAGILRRLGQGRKALQSTLRRRIPSFGPLAYWPMEEGTNATQASSPLAGVQPLTLTRATWAGADTLPSSAPLPVLASNGGDLPTLLGRVPTPATTLTAWHVQWVYRLDAGPATRRTLLRILSTGTVAEWYIQSGSTGTTLLGLGSDDATLVNVNIASQAFAFGQWVRLRFAVEQDGSNIDYNITWYDVGGDAGEVTGSVAGTVGRPTAVTSPPNGYSSDLDGLAIGHISVWPAYNTTAYDRAIDAWTGESAWERARRLATEENLPLARIPGTQTPELVGPQTVDTLLSLQQAAADADGGLLLEDKTRPGLVLRERSSLYSQTPKLTLAYKAAPGLAAPLQPVDDDTAIRNDRTVVRDGGGEGRAVLEEGPLSVDAIGQYDDSVTLSLHEDAQAEPIAYWRLHLGTVDGPRYPTVRVLLHKAPHLIPDVLALVEGDLIRITGLPKYVGSGDVDLIVEGIHHEVQLQRWEVTFNCSPGRPWTVGELEEISLEWADTTASELATAATDTATTVDVITTEGLVWWTDPADTPYALTVGGEELAVVAGGRLINTNPLIEDGISGWSGGTGSTVAHSTAVVHPQAKRSILVTPNGSGNDANAVNTLTPVGSVLPGAQYVASMWVYSPGGYTDIRPIINWYNSSGAYLSTTSGPSAMPVPAGVWTFLQQTLTAPASASRASVLASERDTPAAGDIFYAWAVRITQPKAAAIYDDFGRTLADGWGQTDSGHTWTLDGAGAADYDVTSGYGTQTHPTVLTAHISRIPSPHADSDIYCDVATAALATGGPLVAGPVSRCTGNSNFYTARISFNTSGTITMILQRRVASVDTNLDTYTAPFTHTAGVFYRCRLQTIGTSIRVKFWLASDPEPSDWHMEATDSGITAATNIGLRSFRDTGNSNANAEVRWDRFELVNPQTVTVQRSVNGIVKAHAAGADVRLAHPPIVAL